MKTCMITFRSVMPAQQGERAIRQAGIAGTISRTPRWMQEKGCGYRVQIPCEDVQQAVRILRQNRIPMQKVFLIRGEKDVEELPL